MGADNLHTLQRGLRDLVALTTLPAIWIGSQPEQIAEGLADVILTTLRLDFVYVSISGIENGEALEIVRIPQQVIKGEQAHRIGQNFAPWLTVELPTPLHSVKHPLRDGLLYIAVVPIGQGAREGFAIAGTQSPHALDDLDRLLLRVAANQAVIALQQAQLLSNEQAARANAQRTTERITLLQELTSRLSQVLTVEQIAQVMLEMGTQLLGSDCSRIYRMSEDNQSVHLLEQVKTLLPTSPAFEEMPLTTATPVTDAIRTQGIIWMENSERLLQHYPQFQERVALTNIQAIVVVPLFISQQIWGSLELEFTSPRPTSTDEINLLSAIAQQCSQAIERALLSEQARIAATIEERQRLARDLHDAVSQSLFSATVTAEALPRLWERNPQRAFEKLTQVIQLNRAAMAEMRTLLLELRPDVIINNELDVLLEQLTLAAKGRRNIDVELNLGVTHLFLPPEPHVAFYRIAQEAIHNIMKHSQATHFKVGLHQQEQQTTLYIQDNGRGFDPSHAAAGLGLTNMQQRATQIGAVFKIESQPTQGVSLTLAWRSD